jgi:adenosylhomocysteine nucleosidase
MYFRTLVQALLQNAAKAKLRDVVAQAVRSPSAPTESRMPADAPKPCHLGFVFALGIESGCLEDLLEGKVAIRGQDFVLWEGGLNGRRVAMVLSGPGRRSAARAAEILIDGHRPQRVISAGFAGALCPKLTRNDILLADRLLAADCEEIPLELPSGLSATLARPGVHRGPLLTADQVVRLPRERQALFDRFRAMAVDMETIAVAEVCRRREMPFSAVRVINDVFDETLPRDVGYLLAQKPGAAQMGAALGTIWRRPGSVKELYRLRENALVASGRLAKFLAEADFT